MIKCPKCHHVQDREDKECLKCGIIFERYHAARRSVSPDKNPVPAATTAGKEKMPPGWFGEIFFYTKPDNHMIFIAGRAVILIVLIIWGVKFIFAPLESNYAAQSFWHLVNLPFHEAGHIFFRILGPFMTSLGGTLGQFGMPLVCLLVLLLKTRDPFGACVAWWWFGQNFFDIAPYVNDARSLSLPLLGGNVGHASPYGFHDWEYLLSETGLLQYDHFLARVCLVMGILVFLSAYLWGGALLYKQYRRQSGAGIPAG